MLRDFKEFLILQQSSVLVVYLVAHICNKTKSKTDSHKENMFAIIAIAVLSISFLQIDISARASYFQAT